MVLTLLLLLEFLCVSLVSADNSAANLETVRLSNLEMKAEKDYDSCIAATTDRLRDSKEAAGDVGDAVLSKCEGILGQVSRWKTARASNIREDYRASQSRIRAEVEEIRQIARRKAIGNLVEYRSTKK